MADMPIDPGFVRPRFANVDIELDLGADKELVAEGEVVDFPIDPLPVLPVLQLSHLQSIVGLQTAWYIWISCSLISIGISRLVTASCREDGSGCSDEVRHSG